MGTEIVCDLIDEKIFEIVGLLHPFVSPAGVVEVHDSDAQRCAHANNNPTQIHGHISWNSHRLEPFLVIGKFQEEQHGDIKSHNGPFGKGMLKDVPSKPDQEGKQDMYLCHWSDDDTPEDERRT